MDTGQHIYLFLMATTMWTMFFLAGIPSNYYQSWPILWQMVGVVIVPAIALGWVTYLRVRTMDARRAAATSIWMALYFTAPFLIYDWIYIGMHLGFGWSFLSTHWYLSVFYIIPWLLLPPIGFWAGRRRIPFRREQKALHPRL
jgi:hypothetical protein